MPLKRFLERTDITKSWDSTWQEITVTEKWYWDSEKAEVVLKSVEEYTNLRKPQNNETTKLPIKRMPPAKAPKKIRVILKKLGYIP